MRTTIETKLVEQRKRVLAYQDEVMKLNKIIRITCEWFIGSKYYELNRREKNVVDDLILAGELQVDDGLVCIG